MRKTALLLARAGCLLLAIAGCDMSNWVIPTEKRVTFALVIDDLSFVGIEVIAAVHEHDDAGALLETVQGAFVAYPNTTTQAWAQMTTLEPIMTNRRYHLDFFFDMNGDGLRNIGDRTGYQTFEVTPNAVWSETKFFVGDLDPVP